jgi:glutamate:GABA antiporter
MGAVDIVIFSLGTGISLRWCAVAAGAGPASMTLWAIAFLGYYIPLVIAVAELSSRFQDEGGLYVWTRETLGNFGGFLTGWLYWTSNLPYFPGLLYFAAGVIVYMMGSGSDVSTLDPTLLFAFSFGMMAAITLVNIIGLNYGKWLTNLGGLAAWATIFLLLIAGAVVAFRSGPVTQFDAASWMPSMSVSTILLWGTIVFALSGSEAMGFLRSEARADTQAFVRALFISGALIISGYTSSTLAILVTLKPDQVSNLAGLSAAFTASFASVGWPWLDPVAQVLLIISTIGLLNGWYVATARLPFAAGLDSYLPASFGKRHPKWDTPYLALLLQSGLAILFLVLSQAGATVKETYDFLIRMGVLGYMLPYLFIFWAYIRVQSMPASADTWRPPGRARTAYAAGGIGILVTSSAIIATLIPDPSDPNGWQSFFKVLFAGLTLIGSGIICYGFARRGIRAR